MLQELLHLGRDVVAGDHAAGDLGRGARDVRDVDVGERHALGFGGALHRLRGVPRGACGVPGAVRVTEGAVDRDRGLPRVDLVADGVAGERRRDAVDVVDGEVAESVVELRQIHDPHSRHKHATSWGISAFRPATRVNCVFPPGQPGDRLRHDLLITWLRTRPSRMSASLTSISSKPNTRKIADEHRRAADDHVDPTGLEARVVRPLRGRSRWRACGTRLPPPSRVSRKWWIRSGSYSGSPCSTAATVVTVPARPTSVVASGAPGITRGTSATRSRTTETAFDSSSGAGGSECRNCSVMRTHPMSSEISTDRRVGAEHELGGAAADVDDEVRRGRVEVGGGAEERQRRLLLAGEQLRA